jgi:hypothetical protein
LHQALLKSLHRISREYPGFFRNISVQEMGNGVFIPQPLFKRKNSLGLWSEREKIEIEKATKMLKESAQFVAEHFYYGVPVVVSRKSIDPLSPIWVTPDTHKVMKRVEAIEQLELQKDWEMIQTVPTTVMITYKGKVKVVFEKPSIQYELTMDSVMNAFTKNFDHFPIPSPPNLENKTSTSLTLSWINLPDPPGISQYVEVQYRKYRLSSNPDVLLIMNPPSSWSALVSRSWDRELFTSYHFSNLFPGISYQFRLRYRSHRGWSEYSEPSALYTTQPDRPVTPQPPTSSAILPHAIHLCWSYPWHNGSLVTSFILEGKSVGEPTFHELFRGLMLAHIVFGLQPNHAYIFRLKAINAIGESHHSDYYSIQTPAQYSLPLRQSDWRGDLLGFSDEFLLLQGMSQQGEGEEERENVDSLYFNAMRCGDAWRQFFDIQTQQNFYFNILTGSRQLQLPRALQQQQQQRATAATVATRTPTGSPTRERQQQQQQQGSQQQQGQGQEGSTERKNDLEVEMEKNIQFRLKRFRFLKDLRSYRQDRTSSPSPSPSRSTRSNGPPPPVAAGGTHTLSVDRNRIVFDTFSILSTLRSGGVGGDLRKRFRVQFQNELGIDSGGLTKEFYLLLSKQMIQYLLLGRGRVSSSSSPSEKKQKWIITTASHKIFFNEISLSDLDPLYQPSGQQQEQEQEGREEEGCGSSTVIENYKLLHRISGKDYIRFVGRMIGKALYDNQMIDVPLSGLLLAYMVTSSVALLALPPLPTASPSISIQRESKEDTETEETETETVFDRFIFTEEDFKDYDPDLHRSLSWMLANDMTTAGLDDLTFTVSPSPSAAAASAAVSSNGQSQQQPQQQEILLCKGGDKRVVTEENKREYVQYLIQWKVQYSVATLLQEFLEVFLLLSPPLPSLPFSSSLSSSPIDLA